MRYLAILLAFMLLLNCAAAVSSHKKETQQPADSENE